MKAKKKIPTWSHLRIKPEPCEFAFVSYIPTPQLHSFRSSQTEKIVKHRGSDLHLHTETYGPKARYAMTFIPDRHLPTAVPVVLR